MEVSAELSVGGSESENQKRYVHNEDDRRRQLVLDSGAVASSCLVYVLRSRSHEVMGPALESNSIILHHASYPTRLSSVYIGIPHDIKSAHVTQSNEDSDSATF